MLITLLASLLLLDKSLAGAAGVLIGLCYNSIEPLMGMTPGIKALYCCRCSWWYRYYPGAALGGFVIGLLETLSTAIGLSSYRDAIVYGVLIVILLVRPAGILSKNVKEKVYEREEKSKSKPYLV